jgi:flagellar biosynthesis/type III secretory pathway chaperone
MNDHAVIAIARQEQKALKEFLEVLQDERDAIISFSLEGIIRQNNRKEQILKKLEFLKSEKDRLIESMTDKEDFLQSRAWRSLVPELEHALEEVKSAVKKNMRLLSFSIDHVKSSIEHIVGFINGSSSPAYGKKQEQASILLSKVI